MVSQNDDLTELALPSQAKVWILQTYHLDATSKFKQMIQRSLSGEFMKAVHPWNDPINTDTVLGYEIN